MDYFFSAQRTRPKSAGGQAQACAAKGVGFQTAPFGGLDFLDLFRDIYEVDMIELD